MEAVQKKSEFEINIKEHRFPESESLYNQIESYLIGEGFIKKWAIYMRKNIVRDWNSCDLPVEKKLWALERGFLPSRIALYDLNEDNYKSFISDFDYFRIHPMNNHFAFWINDKITLKYILTNPVPSISNPSKSYNLMPEYYLYIENDGHFSYLMDSPNSIAHDENYLTELTKEKGILALKPSNGGGGFGFVKLEYKNNQFFWNDEETSEGEIKERMKKLYGYIITAFITQHPDFDVVWDRSACTLRIVVVKQIDDQFNGGELKVISSYARFGTEASDGACNMHTGGVAVSYDFETGEYGNFFFRYMGFGPNGQTRWDAHPDTGYVLKGKKLPYWEEVKDAVYSACAYLSSLEYFGVDVVVTEHGVQILEINSLPAISSPQGLQGGIYNNRYAEKFFKKKLNKRMSTLTNRTTDFSWREILANI